MLICIDLDGFDQINARFGHADGDRALRRMGRLLRDSLRPGDVAARMGGDEFVLWLLDTDPRWAHDIVDRIRAAAAAASRDEPWTLTLSGGWACPGQCPDADLFELLATANAAMLQDKALRRRSYSRIRQGSPAQPVPSRSAASAGSADSA